MYRHGDIICTDGFSRATFLIFKKPCLQVGQHETVGLQMVQMLWPPIQKVMGSTMYSLQAGHTRSVRTLSPMSDTAVCMLGVTTLSCTSIKKGDVYLKHISLINTIPWLSFLTPTQSCFSLHTYYRHPLRVFALHSLLLYSDSPPPRRPSLRVAQAIFEPELFPV